jgi:hypothetical protein
MHVARSRPRDGSGHVPGGSGTSALVLRPSDCCRVLPLEDHGQGRRVAPSRATRRPQAGAPLTVILCGERMPGARRTVWPLLLARSPGSALRRVAGLAAGAGEGRCGQPPAPVRCRARGSGPSCPPSTAGPPATSAAHGPALSQSLERISPCAGRAWLHGSGQVPDGLARRRRALEVVGKVVTGGQEGTTTGATSEPCTEGSARHRE